MYRLCLAVLLSALASGLLATASRAADIPPSGALLGVLEDGTAVYLRALDDPANPYRGQYSAYDEWVYNNQRMLPQNEIEAFYQTVRSGVLADRYRIQLAQVDEQGYLVPEVQVRLEQRRSYEGPDIESIVLRSRSFPEVEAARSRIAIHASGELPADLEELQRNAWNEAQAYITPPIPAWLGSQPPLQSIFVPNGEILCQGPLGLNFIDDGMQRHYFMDSEGQLWYRYSAEGRLLGTYDLGSMFWHSNWRYIYWPTLDADTKAFGSVDFGGSYFTYGFTVYPDYSDKTKFNDYGSPEPVGVLAAFDFDGTPLDPKTPLERNRFSQGSPIQGSALAAIYAAQLRLGFTSAETHSPYAGTPEGPLETDPAPRPRPLIAKRDYDHKVDPANLQINDAQPNTFVEVRALDDPANPYRADYGPWDEWIRGQVNAQNPVQSTENTLALQQRKGIVATAKSEKRALTEDEQKQISELSMLVRSTDDYDEAWAFYDVSVTPEGWQVPLARGYVDLLMDNKEVDVRDWNQSRRSQFELAPFRFQGNGVMPPEMREGLERAKLTRRAAAMPAIPAWLLEQPVQHVMFMPQGEVVTFGLPGSYHPEAAEFREQRAGVDKNYHRYSAAGELLATVPAAEGHQAALYDPAMMLRLAEATALDYEVKSVAGVTLLQQKFNAELLAAYDWDGTVLDHTQPILRVPAERGHWINWEELQAIARLRGQLP